MMDSSYIRALQNLEYMECLRNDIEKDIITFEKQCENEEIKRIDIERRLIEEAEILDYEMNRCNLSPKTLRLKRLEFFTGKLFEKNKPNDDSERILQRLQCKSITKKGSRCLRKSILGKEYCHIHEKSFQISNSIPKSL